ncbi:MAG: iron ABC transporter permease [Gammaproteobacteria bacterium]|nr:iron ABC transporter permease [Gammaproteobacteria bacterium]MCF6229653.1 iron ABC transporter permease [Gammaproteobacteria bacterium]
MNRGVSGVKLWGTRLFSQGWRLSALAISLVVLTPVVVILWSLFSPDLAVWQHLKIHLLWELTSNTFWLVLGTASGTLVLGVALAWLTAVCEFPGRKIFSWALMLPLAVPAYVTAFVMVGILDFTGPLQTWMRAAGIEWQPPEIRSLGGVILVMVLAFYPYVYLIARNAFATQGKRALEAAQSLGYSPRAGFFWVALPMARPWIIGGVMLVIMETLADFGTVSVFNYDTFTTGIYKAWFDMYSLQAASQLASILVIFVFIIVLLEQQARARMRYTTVGKTAGKQERIQLMGWSRLAAVALASGVVLFAFIIPMIQLLIWVSEVAMDDLDSRYFEFLWHSLLLAAMAALLVVSASVILAVANRYYSDLGTRIMVRVATLGYALPGPVLAVGAFIPIAWLDNQLRDSLHTLFGYDGGLLLQGTMVTLLVALCIRFMAVGFSAVDGNLQRITRSVDESAHSLGSSGLVLLRRVHLPILRGGIFTAMTLVFVDVMKEMPITLMTRPFGWDTLAVRVFEMTAEGEWERAALPSVAIVLAGLIPIILMNRHAQH